MIPIVVTAWLGLAICWGAADCAPQGDYGRAPWWPHEQPAIYATAYSWELGGINCDGDCSHTSLTHTGPELFGRTAACPVEWLGHIYTTVVTVFGQDWYCVDTFGDEANQRLVRVNGEMVYRMDFAIRVPADFPYNQWVTWEWSRRWEPMSKFRELRQGWLAAMTAAN